MKPAHISQWALQSYIVFLMLRFIFISGNVQEDEVVVDSNVLPYCSLDQKKKKSLGEMEQEFLQALQVIIHSPRFSLSYYILQSICLCTHFYR